MPTRKKEVQDPLGLPVGCRRSYLPGDSTVVESVLHEDAARISAVTFASPFLVEPKDGATFVKDVDGPGIDIEKQVFPMNDAMAVLLKNVNGRFECEFDGLHVTKGVRSGPLDRFCKTGTLRSMTQDTRVAAVLLVQPDVVSSCSLFLKSKSRRANRQGEKANVEKVLVNEYNSSWLFKMQPNKVLVLTGSIAKHFNVKLTWADGGDMPWVVTMFKRRQERHVSFGENSIYAIPRLSIKSSGDEDPVVREVPDISVPFDGKDALLGGLSKPAREWVCHAVGETAIQELAADVASIKAAHSHDNDTRSPQPTGIAAKKRRLEFDFS